MEPRRVPQNNPKIRQVGFTFNSQTQNPHSQPPLSTTISGGAVENNTSTLSPVMIPPPPFLDTSTSLPVPVPAAAAIPAARRVYDDSHSYLAASSPESTQPDLSEDWLRSSSGKYSLAFDMSGVNSPVADEQSTEGAEITVANHG